MNDVARSEIEASLNTAKHHLGRAENYRDEARAILVAEQEHVRTYRDRVDALEEALNSVVSHD